MDDSKPETWNSRSRKSSHFSILLLPFWLQNVFVAYLMLRVHLDHYQVAGIMATQS